jgi:hypothetical protein
MSQLAQEAIQLGARGFDVVKSKLDEVFGEGWKILTSCKSRCSDNIDEVLTNGIKHGDDAKTFGKKIDDFFKQVKQKSIPVICSVKTLAVHITAGVVSGIATQATLEYVSERFFGFSLNGESVDDEGQEQNDFAALEGLRVKSVRAGGMGRRNCDTTKLTREAAQKPNANRDFEDAHKVNDPGYHKLPSDNHRLVLTAHHIVPIDLDRRSQCANNLKLFKSEMKNPCTLMKAMLRFSKIDPYVNICNIVLLPDKRFFKKKAKTNGFDGTNGNSGTAEWESDFRSTYPSAVDHSGLNSFNYVDDVWQIISNIFTTSIQSEQDFNKRRSLMCLTLQGISVKLLFANTGSATNPFSSTNYRKF